MERLRSQMSKSSASEAEQRNLEEQVPILTFTLVSVCCICECN